MRRNVPIALAFALLALVLAGAAAAGNGGLGPPSPVSPNAARIRDAYWFVAIFTGAIFVLVEGALIVFIVRFRRGRRPREEEGPQIHGSTRLELTWTVLPVLVLAAIGSFVFYKLPGIENVPAASAGGRLNVRVEGRQFYWEFVYPGGAVSVDRLRIPVDEVVTLDVTAPDTDVIHSWWIPRLGGKIDAIPGRLNRTWIRAKSVGVYRGQCAELCGIFHAGMVAHVEVMPRDAFERWQAAAETAQQEVDTQGLGRETFEGVCLKCHNLTGPKRYGPTIGGNPLLADERGLTTLVQNGRGLMPAVASGWQDAQLRALLAYAKTKAGQSGG